jgi:hypothetical protein
MRNVRVVFALMGCVATTNATTNARLARPRKRVAEWMAFADPSNTTRIRTTSVPMVPATVRTCAGFTMETRARRWRNVCRTIASMVSVVKVNAWARAKRARPQKKAAAATEHVDR